MNPSRSLFFAPVVLAVLGGASSEGDELGFAPVSETSRSRDFREEVSWSLETMDMTADGSPVDQPFPEVTGEGTRRVAVSDTLVAAEGSRILELLRTFETLESTSGFVVDDRDNHFELGVECASDLTDAIVRFRWDEEEEEYVRKFEEGGGADELLDGLELDMDLTGLLPDQEVSVDESWEVDPNALAGVFRAGGDVWLRPSEADEGSLFTVPSAIILASAFALVGECTDDFEGEVTATYKGMREIDDERLAEIELAIEVSSEADRTEAYREYVDGVVEDADLDGLSLDFAVDIEAEARLYWKLEEGRMASFELEGQVSFTTTLAWTEDPGFGDPVQIEGNYEVQGTTSVSVSVE